MEKTSGIVSLIPALKARHDRAARLQRAKTDALPYQTLNFLLPTGFTSSASLYFINKKKERSEDRSFWAELWFRVIEDSLAVEPS
jgi:hypothetical protein